MNVAIIVFPGSNCDHDAEHTFKNVLDVPTTMIWHKETSLQGADFVFLPGGFSFGDYLRSGSIARFSPIMNEVIKFAQAGGPVMGVCNGFQILTECHLLPGALMRNRDLKFLCETVTLKTENTESIYTQDLHPGELLRIPIAHGEGNYMAAPDVIQQLNDENRVAFRYSSHKGHVNDEVNINGSMDNIAGILSENGRILGMMPHPERAVESDLGSADGKKIFDSLVKHFVELAV